MAVHGREQALAEPRRRGQPRAVRARERLQAALGHHIPEIRAHVLARRDLGLHGPPRHVVDRCRQRRDRALEERVVVEARARRRADRHHALDEGWVHHPPVVRLLPAHAEADHGLELLDAQVLRQQRVLRPHQILVPQRAGLGKEGLVAGTGALAVAQHRHYHDVVRRQRVERCRSPRHGRVDQPRVARRDQYHAGRRRGVVRAVRNFHIVQRRA